ncbi:sigma-E factor negative regulatory protein [Sessilibacter corallicola]|uniref:Anti sigma-E protein RseA N-terminal domain-containing protein n=1 Tax=Sessilibacter corallicola TaxID=2904075 RepID=A0ABQ0A456_9GAMM|nr:sigma-E factor negative regulatory protein [Sessilibacter corallicola]MCE2026964.1 sigma-E factor negative regulatory protein [Sessilibacter corallicola]
MAQSNDKSQFDESLKQSLSALMDGEASELELRRLLQNGESQEVRDTWSRYQLASQIMHSETSSYQGIDLSKGISEMIAEEPAIETAANDAKPSRFGAIISNFGKAAIAASVAVVAVFVVDNYQQDELVQENLANNTVAPAVEAPAADTANLPIGYGTNGLNARTVSTDSQQYESQRRNAQPVIFIPRTESEVANPAVEEFLQQLMAEHANTGVVAEGNIPFERVPRVELETSKPAQIEE